MLIASILPVDYLEECKQDDIYMVLLPYLEDKKYASFYINRFAGLYDKFTILDNGAAEGHKPDLKELLDWAQLLQINELILPDCIGNRLETERLVKDALNYIEVLPSSIKNCLRLMAVPQALTFHEWLTQAKMFAELPQIDTIGIPKHINSLGKSTRLQLAACLLHDKNMLGKNIHLLGCRDNPYELTEINQFLPGLIRSCDSSLPYMCAHEAKSIIFGRSDPNSTITTINFSEGKMDQERESILQANLVTWRGLAHAKM